MVKKETSGLTPARPICAPIGDIERKKPPEDGFRPLTNPVDFLLGFVFRLVLLFEVACCQADAGTGLAVRARAIFLMFCAAAASRHWQATATSLGIERKRLI